MVATRLTGSSTAAFWSAILWISNSALMVVMTWSSAYNQALCGLFLLLAFLFLLRYVEGLSNQELAEEFQLEKNNVAVRLHRIRLRLQTEMER